jgi:hypothetical protein
LDFSFFPGSFCGHDLAARGALPRLRGRGEQGDSCGVSFSVSTLYNMPSGIEDLTLRRKT